MGKRRTIAYQKLIHCADLFVVVIKKPATHDFAHVPAVISSMLNVISGKVERLFEIESINKQFAGLTSDSVANLRSKTNLNYIEKSLNCVLGKLQSLRSTAVHYQVLLHLLVP